MLTSVVLYTSANLCVKELSHLGTFQLVFLRSAVSLLLCVVYLWRGGIFVGQQPSVVVCPRVDGDDCLVLFHTVRHIPWRCQ